MENKYRKYYHEMFRTYESEFFTKLWGDHLDEYEEEYTKVYKYELAEMGNYFVNFMLLHQKYKLDYDEKAIGMYILNMFEGLGGL